MSKTNFSKDEPPKVTETETNSDYPSLPLSHLREGRGFFSVDNRMGDNRESPITLMRRGDWGDVPPYLNINVNEDDGYMASWHCARLIIDSCLFEYKHPDKAHLIKHLKISAVTGDCPRKENLALYIKTLDDLHQIIYPIISSKEEAKLPSTPEDPSPKITECGFKKIEDRTIFNVTTDVQTIGTTLPFDSAETF